MCAPLWLVAVILCSLLQDRGSFALRPQSQSPGYWKRLTRAQGPNVCVVESLPKLGLSYHRIWTDGSHCDIKTVVKFQCCQGYDMVPGEKGCPLVKPQVTLLEIAQSVNAGILLQLQENSGLSQWLLDVHRGAVTVLAPSNKAMKQLSQGTLEDLDSRAHNAATFPDGPALLVYHTIEGRLPLTALPSDSLVTTLYNEQPVRFNVFPSGLVTANCVPVVQDGLHTSQGLLHTLELPLNPSPLHPLAQLVALQSQLRRFAASIAQAGLGPLLRGPGPFTLFAPTDEAFEGIPEGDLQALMFDEQAVRALVDHHLVDGVQCAVALGNATLRTRGGTSLQTRCTLRGTTVSGARILKANLMASNGVLHLVDRVVLPRRARTLDVLLKDLGLTTLRAHLENCGLDPVLRGRTTFTMFAPSNKAFQALDNDTQKNLGRDPPSTRELLLGHMTDGRRLTKHLLDKQVLPSRRDGRQLRIKLFKGRPMIDDAVILKADIEGINGVLHIVDKLLFPPRRSITEHLVSSGQFGRFIEGLNKTSPSLLDLLESEEAPFTVFAVSDKAIDNWATDLFTYDRMMAETRIVNSIMRNHVVADTVFTTGLVSGRFYQLNSLGQEPLLVKRWQTQGGPVYAGIALVQEPDILCTNGVLHIVNRLIQIANPSYS